MEISRFVYTLLGARTRQNVYQISLSESKLEKCQFCHKMSHLKSNDMQGVLEFCDFLSTLNSPPPVDNLNLRLGPAVAEELLVGPGRQEDRVKPEQNHEHDHGDVLGARHRLCDSPHVQRRPHRHGACHGRDVHLLLSVYQPHSHQLQNQGKFFKSF